MAQLPRISIITVCFNSAATIRDTMQSIMAQDVLCESIVVDGGSTDGTIAIVKEFGNRVDRCVSAHDRGIYDAMNKGIALATGEIVGFLNSDDFYSSRDALSSVAAIFAADSSLDAVYGDLCYVKRDEVQRVARYWRSTDFVPGSFERGWCPPHPTFFVRRSVYERLGGFDLDLPIGNDVELMMRFLEVHRIKARYLPKTLVTMRLGGVTNRSMRNIVRQNIEIVSALRRHGLRASWLRFAGYKLLSRCVQFVTRPS